MASLEATSPKTAIDLFNASAQVYEKTTGGCTRELARLLLDLPQLADAGASGTVVLDNACGTGIVAEEIVHRHDTHGRSHESGTESPAKIFLVDPAPNMVEIVRSKVEARVRGRSQYQVTSGVMPGERLEFEDNIFTHSFTNLGILFFADGSAGAKEIYRTLRPGGVAVVTSWISLGHLDLIIRPAQLEIRPNEEPFRLPIKLDWFSPDYLRRCLTSDAGFNQVEVTGKKVHYGARTIEELAKLLADSFQPVCKDWDVEERARFGALVRQKAELVAERYTLPDGQDGFGVPMIASVAVCKKGGAAD